MRHEERSQLKGEVGKAHRAERAYSEFIKPFIEAKHKIYWAAFKSSDPENKERLAEIRRMTMAIDALDQEIQEFITTGKLAEIALAKEDENGN
jgi:hypothetical protein